MRELLEDFFGKDLPQDETQALAHLKSFREDFVRNVKNRNYVAITKQQCAAYYDFNNLSKPLTTLELTAYYVYQYHSLNRTLITIADRAGQRASGMPEIVWAVFTYAITYYNEEHDIDQLEQRLTLLAQDHAELPEALKFKMFQYLYNEGIRDDRLQALFNSETILTILGVRDIKYVRPLKNYQIAFYWEILKLNAAEQNNDQSERPLRSLDHFLNSSPVDLAWLSEAIVNRAITEDDPSLLDRFEREVEEEEEEEEEAAPEREGEVSENEGELASEGEDEVSEDDEEEEEEEEETSQMESALTLSAENSIPILKKALNAKNPALTFKVFSVAYFSVKAIPLMTFVDTVIEAIESHAAQQVVDKTLLPELLHCVLYPRAPKEERVAYWKKVISAYAKIDACLVGPYEDFADSVKPLLSPLMNAMRPVLTLIESDDATKQQHGHAFEALLNKGIFDLVDGYLGTPIFDKEQFENDLNTIYESAARDMPDDPTLSNIADSLFQTYSLDNHMLVDVDAVIAGIKNKNAEISALPTLLHALLSEPPSIAGAVSYWKKVLNAYHHVEKRWKEEAIFKALKPRLSAHMKAMSHILPLMQSNMSEARHYGNQLQSLLRKASYDVIDDHLGNDISGKVETFKQEVQALYSDAYQNTPRNKHYKHLLEALATIASIIFPPYGIVNLFRAGYLLYQTGGKRWRLFDASSEQQRLDNAAKALGLDTSHLPVETPAGP